MIKTTHTTGNIMIMTTNSRETDIINEIEDLERAYAELTAFRNSHPWASAGTADLAATGSILRSIAALELELLDFPGL